MRNKKLYVGDKNVPGEDPPMNKEMFDNLITTHSRANEWTDEDGFMVSATCQMLNVELTIIITNINSQILGTILNSLLEFTLL